MLFGLALDVDVDEVDATVAADGLLLDAVSFLLHPDKSARAMAIVTLIANDNAARARAMLDAFSRRSLIAGRSEL
jgi:hypothetical protein